MYYLRARFYDPAIRRFISEDPARSRGNWYSYCNGNPIIYWDPSGLVDVMLRYIIEKNGGTVWWNSNTGNSVIYMPGHHTVIVNERSINNRMIVDSSFLMNEFGLTESQATHQEGDRFYSSADAALAFALMYHDKAAEERQEYGASIDAHWSRTGDTFSFENVRNSTDTYWKDSPEELDDYERNGVSIGFTKKSIGSIHTHWSPTGGLNFSDPFDYDSAKEYPQIRMLYLVNRNGEILKSTRNDNSERGFNLGRVIFSIK